jgi:hypothetical protein
MRSHFGRGLLAGAICLSTAGVGAAQTAEVPELVTDRPDFTESSEVVGHRVVQIETGLRLEQSDATTRQVSTPQVLVRVGIGSRFELRFAGDGYISQSVQTPAGQVRSNGRSDAELGAKRKFLTADAAGLDMAVIPLLSLATASTGFGSAGYDPGVKLTWARDLPQGFGLSGNFNAASVTDDGDRVWEREVSVSLGHGLGGAWGGVLGSLRRSRQRRLRLHAQHGCVTGDRCERPDRFRSGPRHQRSRAGLVRRRRVCRPPAASLNHDDQSR